MERAIVTVMRQGEQHARDLELPTDVQVGRLTTLIVSALHWDRSTVQAPSYEVEARPLGRFLQPHETLASAGVWDGSWLIFHEQSSTTHTRRK